MDLGAVGLEGLMGTELASDPETKHNKWYGFGFLKQERSGTTTEDDWRSFKLAKTTDDMSVVSKAMLFQQNRNSNNSLLRSNATLFSDGQQMLSFSSPKSQPLLVDKTSQNATFPFSYYPSSTCSKNTGCSSESMHGILAGTRGLFTPSQWMELEHQALIYKYMTSNVPVPSHLLIPIKKALDSSGLCNFSTSLLRPTAMGWGGFHLGFSNSTDLEPGRCRRTDGKKWRCSRDAVVDQKYCERHMNRGRHRSRKPVEGQSGHALTGTTSTNNTTTNSAIITASKQLMMPDNNIVVPGSSASNTLTIAQQHEPKNMHTLASDTSAPSNIDSMFMNNKENGSEKIPDSDSLPMLPSTLDPKPKENPFLIHKQQIPFEESSSNEFGFVTSDSLLNPSQKSSTMQTSRSFSSTQNQTNRETDSQHSLRRFIDDWPKTQSNRSSFMWPELDMQSDRTELSISIPMTSTDFMSSTSSPSNKKVTLSPLRLSEELDPIQMGLGVGNALNDSNAKQANWIPITWESSMGGPLGEVLNLNNNNTNDHVAKNNSSSALNLMTDGWDNTLGSSPTGVLQKTAFGSLSNSSAGSSPRAVNKTQEGASLCNDLLGSTLGN